MQDATPNDSPHLVVGLGNPGPRFARTRHNVGFMVADLVAERHSLRFTHGQGQTHADVTRGTIAGCKVVLAKPCTFMNDSGRAVSALLRFYKIPLERILVVYDDIALPLGTIRIREKGSSGGHNGLNSINRYLSTQNYPRLRVGVDRPEPGRHGQIDWVLGHFTKEEQKVLDDVLPRAAEAVEAILTQGIERAMNAYNSVGAKKVQSPKSPGSPSAQRDPSPTANVSIGNPRSAVRNPKSWVERARRIIEGRGPREEQGVE